ncbi:MAG: ABC transporter permease [Nitratireductor sp.]|nr:ABC transporter permease [Nitratireductor sp.]
MTLTTTVSPEKLAERRERRQGLLLVAPAALWTLAFFLIPTLAIFWLSLFKKIGGRIGDELTLANYERFATQGYFRESLFNSLELTAIVAVISICLAYPLAATIAFRVAPRLRRLCLMLAVLPFWTSYVVRSYAWLLVLAPNGVVNQALLSTGLLSEPLTLSFTKGATILGFVHFFTMLGTLTIYASLARINPRLILAARDLGATQWQTFWRVVFPLSIPGVVAGVFLIIVVTIGDYVTPQILGGNNELVLPQTIIMQIQRRADIPMAAALSVSMMLVVSLAYLLMARKLTAERS